MLDLRTAATKCTMAIVLVVEALGCAHAEPVSPFDEHVPRLAVVAPPRFEAHADDAHVYVTWRLQTLDVHTTVIGGPMAWRRAIALRPTHVEVRDTIAN